MHETGSRLIAFGGMPIDLAFSRRKPGRDRGGLGAQPLVGGTCLFQPPLGLAPGRAHLLAASRRRPIACFSRVQCGAGTHRFMFSRTQITLQHRQAVALL